MTTPASVLSLVRQHVEAAWFGFGLVLVVLAIFFAVQTGRHMQATEDAVATQEARDSSLAASQAQHVRDLVELRDTAVALARTQAKLDSAQTKSRAESAVRITAANLARAKASIDTVSVTITTDTGKVTLAVPPLVAVTWAAERAADTSAIDGLKSSLLADSLSLAERDLRLRNDSLQVVKRDSIDTDYDARLKNKDAEITTLKKAKTPRFTPVQGVVAGVLGTLGAILAFVLR